ncbi:phage NrS-1 polymerase family protein [Halorussus salinisoli]|uniref:phage NrS-1 polymerase family protein n=1 Tax=Halorussus salinisoli TaxID=2558242 RepID=UPI0010C1CC45
MGSEPLVEVSVLPDELHEREQWVCWKEEQRDGKATKIPVTPGSGEFASSTDSETWTGFETALDYVQTGTAAGVGFVFTDNDPIVGVDLDDCRDPETGDADDAALDIIERLDSYTEVSPSGTGYHVLVKGDLPDGRNRRGSFELYDTARFFTVTGDLVEETPTRVARRQDALAAVHHEYIQDTDDNSEGEPARRESTDEESATDGPTGVDVDLADEELLEKAMNASNGAKFERLWKGNTGGYDSQSEADMALCNLLAFWTGGDQTRMDDLFRQSGLLRDKWDEVHYADGSTYGEKTIERAVGNTSAFYDPEPKNESTQDDASTADSSADADRDGSKRSQAYLTEKNRLLAERVEELETLLEWKSERIEELEAEVERLTAELTERDQATDQTHEERAVEGSPDDEESQSESVWGRTKRLFGNDRE